VKIKRPAFQFYPSDWRNDGNLRLCSMAARGLLIELMCIAHECDEYGVLAQNGHVFDHKTVGKLTGLRTDTVAKLTEELTQNGVLSRNENGALYSRRMVRDEHVRKIRAEAGVKGGNPLLVNHLVKQTSKQKPTPSSSSSSSSSIIKNRPTLEEVIAAGDRAGHTAQECTDFFNECESRVESQHGGWSLWNGEPMNMSRWQNALARFVSWDRGRKVNSNNKKGTTTHANNGTSGSSRLRSYSGVNKPDRY
jgi:hypothetical protein